MRPEPKELSPEDQANVDRQRAEAGGIEMVVTEVRYGEEVTATLRSGMARDQHYWHLKAHYPEHDRSRLRSVVDKLEYLEPSRQAAIALRSLPETQVEVLDDGHLPHDAAAQLVRAVQEHRSAVEEADLAFIDELRSLITSAQAGANEGEPA